MKTIYLFITILCCSLLASCGHRTGEEVTGDNTADALVSQINTLRTGTGQTAFVISPTLSAIAQSQADFNNTQNSDGLTSAGGFTIPQQLDNAGFAATAQTAIVGSGTEANVFTTFNQTNNVDFTDGSFTEIGVGTAGTGINQHWVVIMATPEVP